MGQPRQADRGQPAFIVGSTPLRGGWTGVGSLGERYRVRADEWLALHAALVHLDSRFQGLTWEQIAEWVGHVSPRTTRLYTHFNLEDGKRRIESLEIKF